MTPSQLPAAVKRFIGDARLQRDRIGESPCRVHAFRRGNDRFFLKTSAAVYAPTTFSVWREASVLRWLAGRLHVPEVVLAEQSAVGDCMVTRCVPGRPLSARIAAGQPVLDLMVDALRQLQAVRIDACPFDAGSAVRLQELAHLLDHGLAADDADLRRWPGLATPHDLLQRLRASVPADDDPVFSHGDFVDSNVFVDDREQLHFIDLGRGGVADRWLDIAFAHRNLHDDVSADSAAALLRALRRPDRPDKRSFFEQLDELF